MSDTPKKITIRMDYHDYLAELTAAEVKERSRIEAILAKAMRLGIIDYNYDELCDKLDRIEYGEIK